MWNKLNKSMMFCQMMFGLSFYGVLVSLTRFFLEDLNYNEADTMMIVGAFSAIGPLFAIAGGFIADKFLGSLPLSVHRLSGVRCGLRFAGTWCFGDKRSFIDVWYRSSKLRPWFDVTFLPKSLQTHF